MRFLFFIPLVFFSLSLFAEGPRVPAQMEVAGIKLKLTEGARKEIQKDVDALTRSPKYFNIKMDRIKLYFPVIEKVFREENVPEDFKYLVIQESALIPDAVSSSNAVGYWQFKEFTGKEVGLRIDRQIDERMHILEASRGAAKYFKKNNFYFDNWLYALQAYQMGPGGAQKVVNKKYFGANKMTINKNTYWYVKKFLAHKIAFEEAYKKSRTNGIMLAEYKRSANKGLKEISRELDVKEEELAKYNMWLRKGKVPGDKNYIVMVPLPAARGRDLMDVDTPIAAKGFKNVYPNENSDLFPVIKDIKSSSTYTAEVIKANGLPAIVAKEGNNFDYLALQGAVTKDRFLKYNDLPASATPAPGKVYYFKKKRTKARIHYHVVSHGETLWDVSQKYGIRVKKLMQKNRMRKPETLEAGRILWLRFIRPSNHPIEYKPVPIPEVIPEVSEPEIKVIEEEKSPMDSTMSLDSVPMINQSEILKDTTSTNEVLEAEETVETQVEEPEVIREEKIYHTVDKGETLYGISRSYEVKVDDLIRWNNIEITEDYRLSIGDKLLVIQKIKEPVVQDMFYHEVKTGETVFQISQQYGLTVDELMELNDRQDSNISIGEKLRILQKNTEEIVPNGVKFHEVQAGETLYQIARKYDLTIQELMDLNQKQDFDIKIGEKIQVSKE